MSCTGDVAEEKRHTEVWLGNLEVRDHLKAIVKERMMILKWILRK
jgi:hypothetical protein